MAPIPYYRPKAPTEPPGPTQHRASTTEAVRDQAAITLRRAKRALRRGVKGALDGWRESGSNR